MVDPLSQERCEELGEALARRTVDVELRRVSVLGGYYYWRFRVSAGRLVAVQGVRRRNGDDRTLRVLPVEPHVVLDMYRHLIENGYVEHKEVEGG